VILYLVRHGQSEGNIVTYDVPDGHLTPSADSRPQRPPAAWRRRVWTC